MELRQALVEDAIAAGRELTDLVQLNSRPGPTGIPANDGDIGTRYIRLYNALQGLTDTPEKQAAKTALEAFSDAYHARISNAAVDADTPLTKLNEALNKLKQVAGRRRRKTRKTRRSTRGRTGRKSSRF